MTLFAFGPLRYVHLFVLILCSCLVLWFSLHMEEELHAMLHGSGSVTGVRCGFESKCRSPLISISRMHGHYKIFMFLSVFFFSRVSRV